MNLFCPIFSKLLKKINRDPKLPKNAMLVVVDIKGAYQNIPHEDGIYCLKEELNTIPKPEIPSDFISKLMELILKYNIF